VRLRAIHLKDFKRFDDLTIDLGDAPAKVIALVGPNGSGKSSVFDAFEEKNKEIKSYHRGREVDRYFNKRAFDADEAKRATAYDRNKAIRLVRADGADVWTPENFYIRSAYRYTSTLNLESISKQPPVLEDRQRPQSLIATDPRLMENYARMQAFQLDELDIGKKNGDQIKAEIIGRINQSLEKVLDIKITSLGNVSRGEGQLFFEKGASQGFPYENLSAGEKEVVDLLLDLFVKTKEFTDTVFCIDEPELHLNTGIQRRLLLEIVSFIPDNCQLWVATHSIGFLRALQEEMKDSAQIVDFSDGDLFSGSHVVRPMPKTRDNWMRVFNTALEDLTGLLAPKRIIYCEGRAEPSADGGEGGMDARALNAIFAEAFHDTLFVSSGGEDVKQNASLALRIISKAFQDVDLWLLKDRDQKTDAERTAFLKESKANRMLERRELENYLYDKEIVALCAKAAGIAFDEARYDAAVKDVRTQDLKMAPVPAEVQQLCGSKLSADKLKVQLAGHVTAGTAVYAELHACIFK